MEAVNQFILQNLGIASLGAAVLFFAKDFIRDALARSAAAKLADKDPSNDGAARLMQSAVTAIDKLPGGK